MIKKLMVLVILMIVVTSNVYATEHMKGNLVIVGGALRADTDEVFEKFITLAGGADHAKIGIVPAASGSPHKYSQMFIEDMTSRGVLEENIVVLELAVKDDKRTEDVDESLWRENGNSDAVLNKLDGITGIWFVGGDQMRITDVLLNDDGTKSKVLTAVWEIYEAGGVIGGTSAGAAIMSEVMLAGGDSFGALSLGYIEEHDDSTLDYQNQGGLVIDQGIGFFKEGIIDQHFDRKARLGRLIVAAYENKAEYRYAFGVEENTALIYDTTKRMISVQGTGGVVVVDMENATRDKLNNYRDIKISYLESVDSFDLKTDSMLMMEDKYTTLGYEYMNTISPIMGGAVSPNQTLKNLIAYNLIDNEEKDEIATYIFDETGKGYEFRFYNTDETEGYWGQSGAADLYSFKNVALDLKSIRISIDDSIEYTIKQNDLLWKIAKNFNTTVTELVALNNISDANRIFVGQVIEIPN